MAATSRSALTDAHVLPVTEGGCPPIARVDITEIYCPAQEVPIIADIVFVHGLKGHPRDTWLYGKPKTAQSTAAPESIITKRSFRTRLFGRKKSGGDQSSDLSHKVGEETSSCFWPYDLLPKDETISQARILLYGYDSHPTNFYKAPTNRTTITQHAENLMHNVAGVREQCQGRPLIFVAHSLGGILVKGALNESRQMTQRKYSDLLSSCHAIVFMGTPHLGAEFAAWGKMMSNIVGALPGGVSTYSGVLRGLEPDSETLYTISRRFNEILNQAIPDRDKIQICSVQEGLGMSGIKGAGSKVVPDYSSKFNRTDIEQSFFNQTANHMTMCKFSSADDQTYKNTLRVLQGYFRTFRGQAEIQQAPSINNQAIVLDLTEKLDFDGRLTRERHLNNLVTHEPSFDWIWDSNFVQWLASDAKVFWIAGKPASGKSTLVNYVAKHPRTREIVEGALGQDLVVAKFFFDFRARDGIENNFEGLRRSLLYQLLETSNTLGTEVKEHFGLKRFDNKIKTTDASMFEFALRKNRRPLLLFIDGLDEYQGHKQELLNLMDSITKFKIKLCLSSRYEKPFTITFKNMASQFRMDVLNQPGICAYAERTFESTLKPPDKQQQRALKTAAETIAHDSAGVFLWAYFAVTEVIDRVCDGHAVEHTWLQKIIATMPPDLEEVYARLFQHMRAKDKKACGIVLQLIDSAEDNLGLSELFEAALLAGDDFRPLEGGKSDKDLMGFQRYLEVIGSGLIECFPSTRLTLEDIKNNGGVMLVRVIHRSVQTYLDKRGWAEILGSEAIKSSHHELWLSVCTRFLAGRHVKWIAPARRSRIDNKDTIPTKGELQPADYSLVMKTLHNYVHLFLLRHAYKFEQETKKSSYPAIHSVLNAHFISEHINSYRLNCSCMDCDYIIENGNLHRTILSNDIQLAVCHRLKFYVQEASTRCPTAFKSDSFISVFESQDYEPSQLSDSSEKSPEASPLSAAVYCYCRNWSSERSDLVLLLASRSSRLPDTDMLVALQHLSSREISALLAQFPEGRLKFESKLRFYAYVASDSAGTDETETYSFGPLWALGDRLYTGDDIKILHLFLARGEDLNAQCGPHGTILHSLVINYMITQMTRWEKVKTTLYDLIVQGADINVAGPEGNVLEYVWRQAHSDRLSKIDPGRTFGALTMFLISMGATNSVSDPNGLIPSEARMLAVAYNRRLSSEDIHYYMHGACSSTIDERDCQREVCRLALRVHPVLTSRTLHGRTLGQLLHQVSSDMQAEQRSLEKKKVPAPASGA